MKKTHKTWLQVIVLQRRERGLRAGVTLLPAGFTLVELMVVVGVVALLMAMVLPAVGKARRSAEAINCAGNIRQVAAAMATYETLYGSYPLLRDPTLGTVTPSFASAVPLAKTWVYTLVESGVLKGVDLKRGELGALRCPSANEFEADASWLGYMPHFGYNFYVNPPVADQAALGERSFQGRRSNMRVMSERKILLADSRHVNAMRGWYGVGQEAWIDRRHAGKTGVNVAFLAGNVELVVSKPQKAVSAEAAASWTAAPGGVPGVDAAHPFSELAFVRRVLPPVTSVSARE